MWSQTNYTAGPGECLYDAQSYFCTDSYVYRVNYAGTGCQATNASTITQIPLGCSNYELTANVVCHNAAASESPPVPTGSVFPPVGWAVTTNYFNRTATYAPVSTCTATDKVGVYFDATRLGLVRSRDSYSHWDNVVAYQAQYCTNDGAYMGQALWSDSTLSSIVRAELRQTGVCNRYGAGGAFPTMISCPSSALRFPLPVPLPTTGYYDYSYPRINPTCTTAAPRLYLQTEDACFDSETMACGVINGTTQVTHTFYQASSATPIIVPGSCPAEKIYKLTSYPVGQCKSEGYIFMCNLDLNGGGSGGTGSTGSGGSGASSQAAVSIGATLMAIMATIIAARQV